MRSSSAGRMDPSTRKALTKWGLARPEHLPPVPRKHANVVRIPINTQQTLLQTLWKRPQKWQELLKRCVDMNQEIAKQKLESMSISHRRSSPSPQPSQHRSSSSSQHSQGNLRTSSQHSRSHRRVQKADRLQERRGGNHEREAPTSEPEARRETRQRLGTQPGPPPRTREQIRGRLFKFRRHDKKGEEQAFREPSHTRDVKTDDKGKEIASREASRTRDSLQQRGQSTDSRRDERQRSSPRSRE